MKSTSNQQGYRGSDDVSQASRWRPVMGRPPRLGELSVEWRGRSFTIPYFHRDGAGGPAVLFVHGLGGAKENFYAALQSPALIDCTVVAFDQPGTGLAPFYPDAALDVSGLADIAESFASQLLPGPYFLAGASMGGLISLLQVRRHGLARIRGLISIEGNLAAEDCIFSRRVVQGSLAEFASTGFAEIMNVLSSSPHTGDRMIAHNLALNVDVRAYHGYSFETVEESDSGRLLEEFLDLPTPRLFLYGEVNRALSYLTRLRQSKVLVEEIPGSAHFPFYDNPQATFEAIGEFVHAHAGGREPK